MIDLHIVLRVVRLNGQSVKFHLGKRVPWKYGLVEKFVLRIGGSVVVVFEVEDETVDGLTGFKVS